MKIMSSDTKSSGLLLGSLIGGAVGAVSALLLAPKTGEKLREDLGNKYRVVNEKMQQIASAVGEKSKDFTSNAEQKKDELTTQVVNETHKLADKANQTKENVINAWKDKEDTKRDESNQRQPQPFSTRT
jgi:gas vesicle protein